MRSSEGYVYIGQTNDINRRLAAHRSGKSKWTKRGSSWELIYSEEYQSRSEAEAKRKCAEGVFA
ncbi:MAG: GIY-YIG nuclease family protein [Candidatus Marinimicrobia bacterium]|nr:GIY-YIG nuclease family protein [Candidatus Neomarinimicrobiota bacterium]